VVHGLDNLTRMFPRSASSMAAVKEAAQVRL